MKLADFAIQLTKIRKNIEANNKSQLAKDIELQSRLMLYKVDHLIEKYRSSSLEVSQESIQELLFLIQKHIDLTTATDAVFPLRPDSPINEFFTQVNDELLIKLGIHTIYAYKDAETELPQQVILSVNKNIFKVHEALTTVIEDYKKADEIGLNSVDKFIVINHSELANNFYNKFVEAYAHDLSGYSNEKKNFLTELKSQDYKVTASYGMKGKERLTNNLKTAFIDLLSNTAKSLDATQLVEFIISLPNSLVQYTIELFHGQLPIDNIVTHLLRNPKNYDWLRIIKLFNLNKTYFSTNEALGLLFSAASETQWHDIVSALQLSEQELQIMKQQSFFLMNVYISPKRWGSFIKNFSITKQDLFDNTPIGLLKLMSQLVHKSFYGEFINVLNLSKDFLLTSSKNFVITLNELPVGDWPVIIKYFDIKKNDLFNSDEDLISLILCIKEENRSHFLKSFGISKKHLKLEPGNFCSLLHPLNPTDRESIVSIFAITKNDFYKETHGPMDVLNKLEKIYWKTFITSMQIPRTEFFADIKEFMSCLAKQSTAANQFVLINALNIVPTDFQLDIPSACARFLLTDLDLFPPRKWNNLLQLFNISFQTLFATSQDILFILRDPKVKVEDWEEIIKLANTTINTVFSTLGSKADFFVSYLPGKNWQLALQLLNTTKENIFINRDYLFTFMLNINNRAAWKEITKDFDFATYVKLMTRQITINGSAVTEISKVKLEHINFPSTHADRERVIGFCLVTGYLQERSKKKDSYYNYFAYKSSQKTMAAQAFLNFLEKDHPLTENGLDEYLISAYKNPTDIKGPLLEGELGAMIKQILKMEVVKTIAHTAINQVEQQYKFQ